MSNDLKKTLGIYYDFWSQKNEHTPWGIYWKGLKHKSNPRTRQYMEKLLIDKFPGAKIYEVKPNELIPQSLIASSDQVVLLYPDAIGLGFRKIEKSLQLSRSPAVLNGRKRCFNLDTKTKVRLYYRRFLARTMLPEMLFTLLFLVSTPVLLAIDLLRGDL